MEWRRGVFEEAPWARRFWTQREYNWAPILWIRSSRSPCEVVLTVDTLSSRSGWPVILWNTSSTQRSSLHLTSSSRGQRCPSISIGPACCRRGQEGSGGCSTPGQRQLDWNTVKASPSFPRHSRSAATQWNSGSRKREAMRSGWRGDQSPALASGLEEGGEETGQADHPEQLVQAAQHRHNKHIEMNKIKYCRKSSRQLA